LHQDNTRGGQIIRLFSRTASGAEEVRAGLGALYPRLWRFALSLTGDRDRAEDLAQATMLRALEKGDRFLPGSHLDRWLFVMARRLWLNELRNAKRRPVDQAASLEEETLASHGPSAETNIFADQVFHKVMALNDGLRVTVLLVYVEGYTYQEAADLLDIPIGTVMSRLSAARKTLRGPAGGQKAKAR
jgi:RNA polymerase sigma-70 factor (ECF subfamily)